MSAALKTAEAPSKTVYYVLSRKPEPNVSRQYVSFMEWNGAFTLLNDSVAEIKDAAKFTSVGAMLERAQIRGQKHRAPSSLSDFQIVKVEETSVPGGRWWTTVQEGDVKVGDIFVIRVNNFHYATGMSLPAWSDVQGAKKFTTRSAALRYAISGSLPNPGGIDSLDIVAVREKVGETTTKYTTTVL